MNEREARINPLTISIELHGSIPEMQLIDLLMKASTQFDHALTQKEKDRAVNYFCTWYRQTNERN